MTFNDKVIWAVVKKYLDDYNTDSTCIQQDLIIQDVNEYCVYINFAIKEYADHFENTFSDTIYQFDDYENESFNENIVSQIYSEIFKDNVINWGRIIGYLYFCCNYSKKLINENKILLALSLISYTCIYCNEKLDEWIVNQGGWYVFVNMYKEKKESTPKKFLSWVYNRFF